jgi:hypothetical protein
MLVPRTCFRYSAHSPIRTEAWDACGGPSDPATADAAKVSGEKCPRPCAPGGAQEMVEWRGGAGEPSRENNLSSLRSRRAVNLSFLRSRRAVPPWQRRGLAATPRPPGGQLQGVGRAPGRGRNGTCPNLRVAFLRRRRRGASFAAPDHPGYRQRGATVSVQYQRGNRDATLAASRTPGLVCREGGLGWGREFRQRFSPCQQPFFRRGHQAATVPGAASLKEPLSLSGFDLIRNRVQ